MADYEVKIRAIKSPAEEMRKALLKAGFTQVDFKIEEQPDNWNLADEIELLKGSESKGMAWELVEEYIKTFIQKVKEDVKNRYEEGATEGNLITPKEFEQILYKRAGKL